MSTLAVYRYDGASIILVHGAGSTAPVIPPPASSSDWSDANPPYASTDPAVFMEGWPTDTAIVDLLSGSGDFYTDLYQTVSVAGRRVVVRCPAAVHHLTSFRLIGTSLDPCYSFGFWHPNLQGLLGAAGPAETTPTVIQMDAASMSGDQLAKIATLTTGGGPLQMGMMRFDGTTASPVLLGGITFQADDQQTVAAFAYRDPSGGSIVGGQPAPHNGVVIYPRSPAIINNCRLLAAGRAVTSQPPFECPQLTRQYSPSFVMRRTEIDGRRAASINPARPRRASVELGNNDAFTHLEDCWVHHSTVSRAGTNDQASATAGTYEYLRVKWEQIGNTHHTEPDLNGGVSLGGYSNASCVGFENVVGDVTVTDCIGSQDCSYTDGQIGQHLQFTTVTTAIPARVGKCRVHGGTWRNTAWPDLDGWLAFRITTNTAWYSDGYANSLDVRDSAGVPLTPLPWTGTWPPTAAQLAAAGATPATHFLIRN